MTERFADVRFEHAMKMKGREARYFRYVVQVQRPRVVRDDVIDGAVDAFDVVCAGIVCGLRWFVLHSSRQCNRCFVIPAKVGT
jgi:hypothetical protein